MAVALWGLAFAFAFGQRGLIHPSHPIHGLPGFDSIHLRMKLAFLVLIARPRAAAGS